jgi:hypothetical protein
MADVVWEFRMRKPKIGDRVAIPSHAIVFIIKSVDEIKKTVYAEATLDGTRTERDIPWNRLTYIDR